MSEQATANEVKKYFEYKNTQEFAVDWKALNDREKEFFRVEVGKVIHE